MTYGQLLFLLQALVVLSAICAGLLCGLIGYLVPTWRAERRRLRRKVRTLTANRDLWQGACLSFARELEEAEQARRWGPPL